MAVKSSEECQNVNSIVVLPIGGTTDLQYEPLPNISHVEVPNFLKSEMCLISDPNSQNNTNLKVDKVNNYPPCIILDVDVEKGNSEIPKFNEESILKSDDSLVRALQREIFLQTGGKFMQLLMNLGTELPKFTMRDKSAAEKVYDTSINRSRKYKRSPSFNFNSRRVVLLFSVLSSLGTIILIYLTLRVRQISDGSGNV